MVTEAHQISLVSPSTLRNVARSPMKGTSISKIFKDTEHCWLPVYHITADKVPACPSWVVKLLKLSRLTSIHFSLNFEQFVVNVQAKHEDIDIDSLVKERNMLSQVLN